ncbi:MAG: energy-coupling factor transporter ATPase [Clostridiales Family XIII bacterium]|jgi:energy-coupling factor transport system ATP-binding protein|nr:energy-coupling factor transporter ATPase [Clostridiales Family XIII bacterium]
MQVRVENLTHTYNAGLAYETDAVKNVSFTVDDGEFIGIIGHTGSGKSTLIQHLNGILKPTSGKIFVGDTDITKKGVSAIEVRKRIGMVFQYPEYQLFEETVAKDIAFGPKNQGVGDEEISVRVREAMALVNIDFNEYSQRSPFELSGGQRRRIAIAGVLAMKPEMLILDEPTAGLDPKAHDDILDMITSIRTNTGGTVVLVSHNMDDVANLCERIFVMSNGELVMDETPAVVFADEVKMKELGLGLPPAREFANELARRGLSVKQDILSIEDLIASIAAGLDCHASLAMTATDLSLRAKRGNPEDTPC